MNEKLMRWSDACRQAGIRWTLFRQSLLCAAVTEQLPEGEPVRVALHSRDLDALLQQVLPDLGWELDISRYTAKECRVALTCGGACCMELDILCPVTGEEDEIALSRRLRRLRKKPLLRRLLKLPWGKQAFRRCRALLPKEDGAYLSTAMTEKHGKLFPAEWFTPGEEKLGCPVMAGWQVYLQQTYGDYEAGMYDDIGVGLTAEEKQALREHQSKCLQALDFLLEVAEEFGLRYTLLAGSVLGPVRHGGFIPWDDDIDVGIRAAEMEEFLRVVSREAKVRLPEGFQVVIPAADDPYPRMFAKLCYQGRCCMDFWPLVPTHVSGFKARTVRAAARLLTKAHYQKIGYKVTKFRRAARVICFFLSDRQIMALARWNERRCKRPTAYINLYSIYSRVKETILLQWLDTPATADFAGRQVRVVGCTEEYLRHLYGDYMAHPPRWKRASRHHELFFQ